MSEVRDAQLHEVAILTRAVENVFRKLIRFLVGRISLVKLQEMISYIYVQESEKKLKKENPKKRVSLTKIAVLSGVDTRTLVRITNSPQYQFPIHKEKRFLKDLTPESCIIEHWMTDQRFLDPLSGEPKPLKVSGTDNSFEVLTAEVVNFRGVTLASIIDRLEQNNTIKINRTESLVFLLTDHDAPFRNGEAHRAFEIGLASCVLMLDTVFYNYQAILDGKQTRYQRGSWSHRISPQKRRQFQDTLNSFLENADEEARQKMVTFEENHHSDNHITAGVGMFYFEDVSDS